MGRRVTRWVGQWLSVGLLAAELLLTGCRESAPPAPVAEPPPVYQVVDVSRLGRGAYLVVGKDAAFKDQEVLNLMAAKGWKFSSANGRSLVFQAPSGTPEIPVRVIPL